MNTANIPTTLRGCANFRDQLGRAFHVPNYLIPLSVLNEAGVVTRKKAAEMGITYKGRDDGNTADDLCASPIEWWGMGLYGWTKKGEIYNVCQLYFAHGAPGAIFVRPDDWGYRA